MNIKKLAAFVCMCLLGACAYHGADGLAVKPQSAAKQPDPNCDAYAAGRGSGDGCHPAGKGMPRGKTGQRVP